MYGNTQHVVDDVPDFIPVETLAAESLHGSPFDPGVDTTVKIDRATSAAEDSGREVPRLDEVSPVVIQTWLLVHFIREQILVSRLRRDPVSASCLAMT